MSISLLTLAWQTDLAPMEKLVLVALADFANDDGEAWPSVTTLVRKTGAGERTVQRAIAALVSAGHMQRSEKTGRGCRYHIHPRHSDTPVTVTPVSERQEPPSERRPTPATAAPDPRQSGTLTIIEPSSDHHEPTARDELEPVRRSKKAQSGPPCKPEGVKDQTYADFLDLRKRKRAPLTETALAGIVREAAKAEWPLEDAIAEAVTRGWQSFKADWVASRNDHRAQDKGAAAGAGSMTDSFFRRMARNETGKADSREPSQY